jgi:hypothetical protein
VWEENLKEIETPRRGITETSSFNEISTDQLGNTLLKKLIFFQIFVHMYIFGRGIPHFYGGNIFSKPYNVFCLMLRPERI